MSGAAAIPVKVVAGLYPPERGDGEEFRWSARDFRACLPRGIPDGMLLVLDALCYFEHGEQALRVEDAAGRELTSFALAQWRRPYQVRLPSGRAIDLVFRLSRTIPPERKSGDPRELGVRIYGLSAVREDEAWVAPPPVGICMESTTRCNLECLTCPRRADGSFRLDGMRELPVELALGVVRSSPACRMFALHGTGEPLLSGTFREILRRAPPGEPRFSFSTNLTLLDDGILDLAMSGSVREIIVSLDAARPETYRLIRGRDMATTLDNVRKLVRARNSSGRRLPRLLAHMVLLRMNLGELPEFVRLAARLGLDGVFFWQANRGPDFNWVVERDGFRFDYRAQRLDGNPEECGPALAEAVRLSRELGLTVEYDATIREFGLPDPEGGARRGPHPQDCPYPWKEANFLSDGTFRFCPLQSRSLALGRLGPGVGINDLWNSAEARRCRATLGAGELPGICRGSGCKYAAPEAEDPG